MGNVNLSHNIKREGESLCESLMNSQVPAHIIIELNEILTDKVEYLIKSWREFPCDARNCLVATLTEQYFQVVGEYPPVAVLCRMTEFLLMETHANRHPDKMANTEYPIMTIHQYNRRKKRNNLMGSEPVMDFLHSKYQLRMPTLYKSTFVKLDS